MFGGGILTRNIQQPKAIDLSSTATPSSVPSNVTTADVLEASSASENATVVPEHSISFNRTVAVSNTTTEISSQNATEAAVQNATEAELTTQVTLLSQQGGGIAKFI